MQRKKNTTKVRERDRERERERGMDWNNFFKCSRMPFWNMFQHEDFQRFWIVQITFSVFCLDEDKGREKERKKKKKKAR